MKKFVLILVLSSIATLNYAQVNNLKQAPNDAIFFSNNFFWGRFYMDGKPISLAKVNAKLMNYQPSAYEFNEYKKNEKLADYSGAATIAFLIIPLITDHFKTVNSTPGKISLGIGYGLLIPDMVFLFKRSRHFRRALGLYNQQFQQ